MGFEVNKIFIEKIPAEKFPEAKINGVQKSKIEVKKFMADLCYGGKNISQIDKALEKAGIKGDQSKTRKRIIDLINSVSGSVAKK